MEQKAIAIVTGAGGGMGKEFVRLLAADDTVREIWCIARTQTKLEQLRTVYGEKIVPVAMDLSDRGFVERLRSMLAEQNPTVAYLINNAGYAKFCAYHDLSLDDSLNMLDLNIDAVVALCLLCLPYMESGSRILNVASQASFQPLPYMNLYAATKAFVRNYTRALNVELKERGITATAVCPGWMDTDLYTRGNVGAKKGANRFKGMVSPAPVAQKALRDARRGKDISVYGSGVKLAHAAAKFLPQKTMMRLWLRQQKIK